VQRTIFRQKILRRALQRRGGQNLPCLENEKLLLNQCLKLMARRLLWIRP
jgi:hypothetical protein